MTWQYISQYGRIAAPQTICCLLFLTNCGVLSTRWDQTSSPIIMPNKTDVTVMPNKNFRLICLGTEPIHWYFNRAFSDYETNTSHNPANKYAYETVLDLIQVDYTYVDNYYCVKNSTKPNTNIDILIKHNQAAKIYVFVEDNRHPLVRASVPILQGAQNEQIIIPCKPTSKTFEVQLFKEGIQRRQIESKFNAEEGFHLRLNSIADAGQYACHAKFDVAEKFDTYFTVEINSSSNVLSEPVITSKTYDYGTKLELNCAAETFSSDQLQMKWKISNENIAKKEGRIEIFPPIFKKIEKSPTLFAVTGRLIIKHFDEFKDSGIYECSVDDSGHVKSVLFIAEKKFEFQKPQVKLNDVFYNVGEHVNISCDITGYPSSKVLWLFIPCEEIDFSILCDESRRVTFNDEKVVTIQHTPLTQSSTLSFAPIGMGVMICEANNREGKTEARANVIVNDLNEDFDIWNENETPIIAGDSVSAICGASAFKYTEMNWYKEDVPIKDTASVQVITRNTPYSQQKEIHWESVEKEATGQYFCRARIINSDRFVNKPWDLHVIEPTPPTIVSSNIESDQSKEYLLNANITLMCKFSGIPQPKIKWYKDDSEIVPIANDSHTMLLEANSILAIHLNADDEGNYKCLAENRAGQISRETNVMIENDLKKNKAGIYGFLPIIIAAIGLAAICVVCSVAHFRR